MTTAPDGLLYSTEGHVWVGVEATSVRMGITDFAQSALGEIVYLWLPEVGAEVIAGTSLGDVESTKTVNDVVAPVTGRVTGRNEQALANPGILNQDPYGTGWLLDIELAAGAETGHLSTADEYLAVTGTDS